MGATVTAQQERRRFVWRGAPPDRVRVAYHEAGHAVAAVVLGMDVEHATIVPAGDTLGHVIVGDRDENAKDLGYWVDRATMCWAGPLAEQRREGTEIEDLSGDDHDSILLFGECASIGSGEVDGFVTWTRARAMSTLNGNWWRVVVVALELLRHNTLSGDEVRRFVAEVEDSDAPVYQIGTRVPIGLAAAVRARPRASTQPKSMRREGSEGTPEPDDGPALDGRAHALERQNRTSP